MTAPAASRLVILGTATALTSADRDNTALYLDSPSGGLLIDCPGHAFGKILRSGGDPLHLKSVLITHAHPDHLYGLPSLLHELWLAERTPPLDIYANSHALAVAGELIRIFELDEKPLPLNLHLIPEEERARFVENDELIAETSPVRHYVPALAVRITLVGNSRVVVYSGDTGPCPPLVNLARGADLLVHECALQERNRVEGVGFHSSPEDAGDVAAQAAAKELLLVHYPDSLIRDPQGTVARVRKFFAGPVRFARDGEAISL
jgi:ribonuclease Z